jgi:glycerophosphoryl diester phosphodiesterase
MLKKALSGLLIFVAVLVIVYIILTLLAEPEADHPFYSEGPPRPWVIAHQGGDGLWPSDTMFAFERAAEMGVDVLEMDMHSTADGELVLMHDSTVDRTTNGTGRINEMTLAEIKALDAGYNWSEDDGQTFPFRDMGITVPTLEEVFTAYPDYRMNIEIKQAEPSIIEPFCQMIRDNQMENHVLVPSFNQESVNEFRQACPEVATSAGESEVIAFFVLSKLFLENIYSPKATALQVPETRSGLTVLTQRLIDAAHRRNLEVHPWTVDETEDMQRMLDMGVDGIITDRPDLMMELLGRS